MAGGADTKVTICGRVLSYVQKANILTDTNDAWSVLDLHMLDIPDAKPEIEFLEELWQCLTKPYPAPSP